LSNLGAAYRRTGEFDRALTALNAALAVPNAAQSSRLQTTSLNLIGLIHSQRGETSAALGYLERSLAAARSLNQPVPLRIATGSLAVALIIAGEFDRASAVLDEAARLFERYPQLPGREILDLNRANLALGRNRTAEARTIYTALLSGGHAPYTRWEAEAGLARALEVDGDIAGAKRHYRRALDIIGDAQDALGNDEFRVSFLTQVPRFFERYAALLVREGEEDSAVEVEDSSRARTLGSPSQGPRQGTSGLATSLRRLAANDIVFVSYWTASDPPYARVISRRGHRRVPLPVGLPDLARLVRAWRTFLERDRGDPLEVRRGAGTEAPAGEALFHALVTPLAADLPRGARVILVADSPLHGLNFETLPVPGTGRLWIDDVIVSIAPSLGLLVERLPPGSSSRSLLAIGSPLAAGPEFPRLAAAAGEIEAVRRHFPSAVVRLESDATPEAFDAAEPARFSHVHFAAHAKANRESPLDSFVMLSPRNGRARLYARDVTRHRLRADLVTLSACRSAGDRAYSGEGLVGLSWAFLRAGASHVIAGLWDVPDGPTARLMELLYENLAAREDPARALRAAKLRFRSEATGPERKPYAWAAFQVFQRKMPPR
jgi:hypothetical protein